MEKNFPALWWVTLHWSLPAAPYASWGVPCLLPSLRRLSSITWRVRGPGCVSRGALEMAAVPMWGVSRALVLAGGLISPKHLLVFQPTYSLQWAQHVSNRNKTWLAYQETATFICFFRLVKEKEGEEGVGKGNKQLQALLAFEMILLFMVSFGYRWFCVC